MRRRWSWWPVAVVVAVVTAACTGSGGDGSDTGATGPKATTSASSTAPTTAAAPTTPAPSTTTTAPGPCGDPATWTLRQRLAQLVLVGLDGAAVADARAAVVGSEPAAGFFAVGDGDRLFRDGQLLALRAEAAVPPLVAVDEEGGRVQRLAAVLGPLPSARDQAATLSPAEVKAAAVAHGRAMRALGIDLVLAPVVDLAGPTDRGVIGSRSYGADPSTVIAFAGAFAAGLREAGVLPTLKHFPGHGRAVGDSHEQQVVAPALAELERLDLVPFFTLVGAAPVAVMVGHLDVPGLTEPGLPSSLSPAAYALLRDRLGFRGLVMTDELGGMTAVSGRFGAGEAVVRAIVAGADLALVAGVQHLPAIVDALVAAVADGRLPGARVNEALTRVLAAKGC